MPRYSTPPPKATFFPPNDSATYRDLLLFEERLKSTALSLQKRKSRYQLFLFQLLTVITFLLYEVLAPPEASLLSIPYTWLLQRLLPELYPQELGIATIHPYLTTGLLFVSVTTLVLFFASGMYSEKIAYANKYVPHANKALRSFNIYLNVRKPPLRQKFKLHTWNPLEFFFPRPQHNLPSSPKYTQIITQPLSLPHSHDSPSLNHLPSPSQYPQFPRPSTHEGDSIFSSRIDKSFREPYERYRATFERKREEKERAARKERWWERFMFWRKTKSSQPSQQHQRTISLMSSSSREVLTPTPPRSGTPPSRRTPTPPSPGQVTVNLASRPTPPRERSVSPSPSHSPRTGFNV
ncbi:hypothetical protein BT96DRAFT_963460 [Gymnopus androsaceus JB14]|uniref:Transmembrane protein 188 n=1 Tax=Gymnopus androsaceus JB14 TaxID=1447944 RepID=A0A6A4I789_9AGAR|nr:hypothetical protein BT96DRAFT_963460 [Gymnopus androsaceus JB14]